jgi:hypothetical protein
MSNSNTIANSNASSSSGNTRLKYCCDLDKTVLGQNFEKRGWIGVNNDDDWNFYWFI